MLEQSRKFLWLIVLMVVIALGALALGVARTRDRSNRVAATPTAPLLVSEVTTGQGQATRGNKHRNLSLQPEASRMGRRLGQRFSPGKREKSIVVGTLTIGSERRIVETNRRQTDGGEEVAIQIAGTSRSLSWDPIQGARSSNSRATGSDRQLIERLVLDSPDQFVLAQLRGASYFTVARNVRPANTDDNYNGPLWDIIRVEDPEKNEAKRPESRWRLYYVNAATGLIDRIESEVEGERMVAEITGWVDRNGEKVPGRIIWTRQGQTVMEYSVTNFSTAVQ